MIIIQVTGPIYKYSRIPVTRTLKGNEKLFELAGFRVIGVSSYRGRLKYSIFRVNN